MDDLSTDTDATRRQLDAARRTFSAAIAAGDARAAASTYSADARLLSPRSVLLRGSAEVEAFWRTGIAAGLRSVRLAGTEVWVGEGLAYETGGYRLELDSPESGPVVERGNYLVVHRRQPDQRWLRVAEAFQPEAPTASTLPRSCNASPQGSVHLDTRRSQT